MPPRSLTSSSPCPAGLRSSLRSTAEAFRRRCELYRLGASAWHFVTYGCAGPDDPTAQLPPISTPPQAQALAALLHQLAATLQAVAPSSPGPLDLGLALALPPDDGGPSSGSSGTAAPAGGAGQEVSSSDAAAAAASAAAASAALPDALRALDAGVRTAVDAAATACTNACEAARKGVGEPGADDILVVAAAQAGVAALLAPVGCALVQGLAGVCQAAVQACLREPDAAGMLQEQLAAAGCTHRLPLPLPAPGAAALDAGERVRAHTCGGTGVEVWGPSGVVWSCGSAPPASPVSLHALHMRRDHPTKDCAGPPPGHHGHGCTHAGATAEAGQVPPSVHSQLATGQQQLQALLGALLRASPPLLAPSAQTTASWLKGCTRLRVQLSAACSCWALSAAAAAGQALLLCGQRHSALGLALDVLGR